MQKTQPPRIIIIIKQYNKSQPTPCSRFVIFLVIQIPFLYISTFYYFIGLSCCFPCNSKNQLGKYLERYSGQILLCWNLFLPNSTRTQKKKNIFPYFFSLCSLFFCCENKFEKMGMAAADLQFHVLAVDDSSIDRKLIERLFKISSCQVTTVDSGSKALEFLGLQEEQDDQNDPNQPCVSPSNQQEVEVNLIITDYCMPGMTGYDLLKKIKESSSLRNIPVVIMSSENVPSRISRCLEEGAEEFFLKPVRLSDVNKLKPHMMKTKCKSQLQEPEKLVTEEKQESIEIAHVVASQPQKESDTTQQQQQQLQGNSNNNKRKAMEENLSPDRTRPRFSSLRTV